MLLRSLVLVAPALAGTQFWPRRPTPLNLQRFIGRHATARPNAPDVIKSTEPGQDAAIPRGCHARRLERVVPGGDYARAKACVLAWGGEPDTKATSFVAVGDRSGGVLQMATVARAYGRVAWVVNPVRESYAVDVNQAVPADPAWKRLPTGRRYACAAYTTLGRHLLAGEERLSVVDQGDCIVVDILSVSRGRGLGRLVYPLIGPMQRRFFRAQLDVVEAACSSPPPPELTPPGAATYGGVRPRVVGLIARQN